MIIKVENRQDVEQASQLVSWLHRPVVDKVIVMLPWLDADQRTRVEKRIRFLFNDCGCLWGGPAFLLTFGLLFFSQWYAHGFSWPSLLVALGSGAAVAVTAKFLGLAWSCCRLKWWFRTILSWEEKKNQ